VVVDLGTGDGRAVLARAAAEPSALVVGVDAAAAAMAEPSRRADRRGPSNALFLAAGAESLPRSPLAGVADLVTVTFPWGSLLRGLLGLDHDALRGMAALTRPGGRAVALLSVVPADGIGGLATIDTTHVPRIGDAWAAAGLTVDSLRPATAADIAAAHSSWARRLLVQGRRTTSRPVWRIDAHRG
jgi:16S rRNA (adenine(1408)-N(1))-methyltransferase